MDAMGVTQECLHTIKSRNLEALILKMDLVKAYNRVNWVYLVLILLQIGLYVPVTSWTMAWISSECFVILINGSLTSFFKCSRGLREGVHFPFTLHVGY